MEVSKQMLHENSPLDSESDPDAAAKPAVSIGVGVSVGVSVVVSDSVGVEVVVEGGVVAVVVDVAVVDTVLLVLALTDSEVSSCPRSGITAVADASALSDSKSAAPASPWRDAHPSEREEALSLCVDGDSKAVDEP